jgi:amino acid permease
VIFETFSEGSPSNFSLFNIYRFDEDYIQDLLYFSILVNSFSCQTNVLSVYDEIEYKTVRKGVNCVLVSFSILSSYYLLISLISSFRLLKDDELYVDMFQHSDMVECI